MHMQMRDGFACVFAVIDDEAEALRAFLDAELIGDLSCCEKQRAECGLIHCLSLTDTRDDFLGAWALMSLKAATRSSS